MQRTLVRKIDPQTLSRILAQLKNRDKCIFLLIYYTDLTIDEVLEIDNATIKKLLKTKELKGLSELFKKDLPTHRVFWSITGTYVTRAHLNQTIRLACRKAGIDQITPAELQEWKPISG